MANDINDLSKKYFSLFVEKSNIKDTGHNI
jgi:hypothetical protein